MVVSATGVILRLSSGATGPRKCSQPIGPINLDVKATGKPSAGKRHAGFDEAGAGDVIRGAGLRPRAKALDRPPDPTIGAPGLDPT